MRKSLIGIFRDFSNQHQLKGQERITRSAIVDWQNYMKKSAMEARATSKTYIQEIVDDIDLYIIGFTSLALSCFESIEADENRKRILLRDFPANDMNLGNCLLNIANTAIAINKLCLEGLDTQARALVRTLDERLLQTPVLFASADDYKRWHEAQSPEESKSAHYDVFAKKKKLYKRYAELEAICFGKPHSADITAWRQDDEYFYSMAIHGASSAVQIGSWAFDYESEIVRPNFFGTPSSASVSTLEHMRFQLFWFALLFPAILEKFHNWQPDEKDSWQRMYMACFEGILKTAHEWLPQRPNPAVNKDAAR